MGFVVLARLASSTSRFPATSRAMVSHTRFQSTVVPHKTRRFLPSFSLENKVSRLHFDVLPRAY